MSRLAELDLKTQTTKGRQPNECATCWLLRTLPIDDADYLGIMLSGSDGIERSAADIAKTLAQIDVKISDSSVKRHRQYGHTS